MKACYYLLGCLALAACDAQEPPVVVNFDQPFPTTAPDLTGFLPRHRKEYAFSEDSGKVLVLSKQVLVLKDSWPDSYAGKWLKAKGIPRRRGSYWGRDRMRYLVLDARPALNSYWVRTEVYDTLLDLQKPQTLRLRYYRGWYYLNSPDANDSTKWNVWRLQMRNGYLTRQFFNPDSLRIQALDPAVVQRQRANRQLIFTLSPQSRRAIGQVSSYAGLWLDLPAASSIEVTAK
jgi:hypothetical protein